MVSSFSRLGSPLKRTTTHRVRQIVQSLWASGGIQLCLFVSGILLARQLGPAGRGNLAIVLTVPAVATQAVCVGVPSAATYFIAKNRTAWRSIARHLVSVSAFQVVLAALLVLGLNWLFLAGKGDESATAGLLALASVPMLIGQYYGLHILQGLGDLRWFNIYRLAPAAAFSLGMAAGVYFGLTVVSCTAIWVASQVVTMLAIAKTIFARANAPLEPDPREGPLPTQREVVRFGIAGFLAQVSPVETFRVDVLLVALLFPSQIVGYYAIALSVSNVPRFIADGLVAVAYPHISGQDASCGHASTRKYMLAAVALCGAASLVLALAAPDVIPLLFGQRFEPAVVLSVISVGAACLISIRRVGTDCLRALGKPGASTGIEVVTLVLLVPAFVVLGPWGDGRGVALSLAISAAVGLVLTVRLLRTLAIRPHYDA